MPTDSLTTAIDLYKYAQSAVSSLWGLYSGVALALLGYILGSKTPCLDLPRSALHPSSLFFAMANLRALWQVQNIGYSAAQSIHDLAGHLPNDSAPLAKLLGTLTLSSPLCVVSFQLLLTLSALAAIWAPHRHDTRAKNATHPEHQTFRHQRLKFSTGRMRCHRGGGVAGHGHTDFRSLCNI